MAHNSPMKANSDSPEPQTHEEWFRSQVELAIAEADSPDALWYEHEAMFNELATHTSARSKAEKSIHPAAHGIQDDAY